MWSNQIDFVRSKISKWLMKKWKNNYYKYIWINIQMINLINDN